MANKPSYTHFRLVIASVFFFIYLFSFRAVDWADYPINHVDLFSWHRMSLKVNRRCQWITVSDLGVSTVKKRF